MKERKNWGRPPFFLRKKGTVPIFFIFFLLAAGVAWAGEEPFVTPGNWGGTGIMEVPTARVLKEGQFRFGVGLVEPYRHYYGAISPFRGVEIDGRFTEVADTPVNPNDPYWQGYGNNKDKVVGIKFQFLPETKWFPGLALGLYDPHGTRLYGSQFIVASKQLYPFDFTIGFGNGRYGRRPLPSSGDDFKFEIFQDPRSWLSDGLLFGGVQFAVTDRLILMAEYSPIRYDQQTSDPAHRKYFQSAVPSKFNYGVRWRPWDWLEADVSYQRGQQLGVNISMNFELGRPFLPIYDLPYREKTELRPHPLVERLTRALGESGFSDIGIRLVGNDIRIEARNDKYYYDPKGLGVVLRILRDLLPSHIENVHIAFTDLGIPTLSFATHREDIVAFFADKLSLGEFLHVSKYRTDVYRNLEVEKKHRTWWDWGVNPAFRFFVNDPSGFFKYRAGFNEYVRVFPWKGSTLMAALEQYPLNNVSTVNVASSQPVRTDYVFYTHEKVLMDKLLVEQMVKLPHEFYARAAVGYLETEYAGMDWEVAKPLWGGRLMVGLSGSVVKKREIGKAFSFKENDWKNSYATAFLNTALNVPEADMTLDLRTGQFLAGDRGTRVTLSKFFNGIILYAWYSFTNTNDVFVDSYNRGYHNKGIGIVWPLRMFIGRDTKSTYSFAISPWTRDVAQDIDHANSLFGFIGRNQEVYWKKDRGRLGSGLAF
ncbi:MAG: YjbH domain-containing protein [Pseudomonadota bacterium]|nr:YjbH domain-containing protein [Pseudomonadota bacterium]